MTATELEVVAGTIEQQAAQHLHVVEQVLAAAQTPADVAEVQTKIRLARAWAKVYGQAKEMRATLLRMEAAALVRMAELGGTDTLSKEEQRAAEYLVSLTAAEREAFLRSNTRASTAAGLVNAHLAAKEQNVRGRGWAERPGDPAEADPIAVTVGSVRTFLDNLLANHTDTGEPFTIDSMADELIADIGVQPEPAEFIEGVREVCRRAIRSATPAAFAGTVVPKFVTARSPAGGYVRIPTPNATVAHLDEALALRREQLRQDTAALKRFEKFVGKVKAHPGVTSTTMVGTVLAQSVSGTR